MVMLSTERGCLVISDLSGYTGYLRDTELEHAQNVLADLTETIVSHLRPALRIIRLEGDAVFGYALTTNIDPSILLDAIDSTYFAFRSRLRNIEHATTCRCNACVQIPLLDLKFVAHFGDFVRSRVAGHEDLTGTDVIVVHRLLKNSITEKLGLRGYTFLSEACITALELDPDALGMNEHREQYGDVGVVAGYVIDMDQRWRQEQERTRLYVTSPEAQFEFSAELPASPALIWDYFTTPAKRLLWQPEFNRIDQTNPGGRRGPGTTNHCVHGRGAIVEEILDWRPFDYYSVRLILPGLGNWTQTVELRPRANGNTEVAVRGERLRGAKGLMLTAMKRTLHKRLTTNIDRLRVVLGSSAGNRSQP
ncbi:MAG TPA: DUF2652 domain-containing protein [Acidimicrobiia bacterium]|nr:DUF2652 domain-containing protein [Acidimicrobiia bacterium]